MTRKEKTPRRARKRKEMMRRKNQRRERERRPTPKRRKMMTMKKKVRRRKPKNPEQPAFKAKYFATCWCNSNTLLPLWLCRVASLPVISADFGPVYHAKKQAFTVALVLHAYTKAMRFRSIHSYVCVCALLWTLARLAMMQGPLGVQLCLHDWSLIGVILAPRPCIKSCEHARWKRYKDDYPSRWRHHLFSNCVYIHVLNLIPPSWYLAQALQSVLTESCEMVALIPKLRMPWRRNWWETTCGVPFPKNIARVTLIMISFSGFFCLGLQRDPLIYPYLRLNLQRELAKLPG